MILKIIRKMMALVLRPFSRRFRSGAARDSRYEAQKEMARTGDTEARLGLAQSADTHREILYYLADNDPAPEVRRALVSNQATPAQARPLLAKDADVDVRLALAARLVDLLPALDEDRQSQLYAFTVQALGMLALDETLKIRRALASALKDSQHAPPNVAAQLAKDIERAVAEPVLRFCVALADEDLLTLLQNHPEDWAIEAIAGRKHVSAPVSKAVIDSDHVPAGMILLGNEGAVIENDLLVRIVQKARHTPEWHKNLASHKALSAEQAQKLAEFADENVRDILIARTDYDAAEIADISTAFKRRMAFMAEADGEDGDQAKRALADHKAGELDEDRIAEALGARAHNYVKAAIALRAKVNIVDVERVFAMRAAKPIVALCWQARLPMRLAYRLQQDIGRIQPKELIHPKDGTDYPLAEEDILWQLDFLGLQEKAESSG